MTSCNASPGPARSLITPENAAPEKRSSRATEVVYAVFVVAVAILFFATAV